MAQIIEPTQHGVETASAAPPLLPEELAPHFPQLEILECLGRGGMGVVYKARQKSLNRLVALKLLAPERADDPQFAARFEKEAHALAALNHPNIVGVYDFGVTQTFLSEHPACFLLMEFVDGLNLRQLMQAKKLTPKEALSIVPPVCDALQCAHDHGIVHRDIKPENLLIDKNGAVKIADFGIAKLYSSHLAPRDEHGAGASTDDSRSPEAHRSDGSASLISRSEMATLGTPDYAAPEQANGTADHRADIYSLGVVLYEMLTGERPKEDFVAPSKRVQVDIRIDEIVLRALEKKPELRFATAAEFRTQVMEAAQGDRAPEQPLSSTQRFFERWMPAHWFANMRRESQAWHLVCECGHATSYWDRGGIRYGASGSPMKLMNCPACGRLTTHRTEWRGEGGLRNPKKGSIHALAVTASVWVTLSLVAIGIVAVVELFRRGFHDTGLTWPAIAIVTSVPAVAGILRGNWMRGFATSAFVLSLACVMASVFFAIAMIRETGGWHPSPTEAFVVTFARIGSILFPLAGIALWHGGRPAGRRMSWAGLVATILILMFLSFLVVGGTLLLSYRQVPRAQAESRRAMQTKLEADDEALKQEAMRRDLTAQLQGTWKGTESGREGECSLTVEGRNVHFQGVDEHEWYRAVFEMLPDTNPQQFRSTITECPFAEYVGKVSLAIIAIDGDRLSFVGNEPGVPIAPPGFEGDGHSRHFVFRKVVNEAAAAQWIVEGRVVDDQGKPVADAAIHVSTGMGSLHESGEGKTNADGRYRVTFGPGIMVATKDRAGALQVALVQVFKDGFEEKDLCRAGDLQMAWELTKQQLAGGWQPGPERTFLPGKPLTVDFVLVPAAQIEGTLIDKNGQPVAGREIVITGDHLRPASSIYAAARTDANGRFTFKDVSTLHEWSFSLDGTPGHPDRTPPDRPATPGVHRITLVAVGNTLSLPLPSSPAPDARTAHALQIRWVAEAASAQTEEMQVRGTGTGDRPIEKLPIEKEVLIDARQVKLVGVIASEASDQQGARRIGLTLSDEGAARFAMLTRQGKGRRLALILSGQLWTAPVIRAEITGGVIEISGSFSETEAAALAGEIRSCVTTYKKTTTTIQGTMKDDDLKQLDCRAFDETPGKYWRELSEVRRFRDAAKLIEHYLELHPDLEPRDAASLHFHAAQCWALIGSHDDDQQRQERLKSAIQHLKAIAVAPRLKEDGKLLPIEYVSGTMGFLLGDRDMLVSAYEKLAKGDAINKGYVAVLDRLLAHFGKSYAMAYDTDGQDHKKLSADCFNRTWELLEKKTRTKEDDDRMISLAHESLAHWRLRADCTDQNLSIGYWQISRVYAVLHQGENAKRFGGLCLGVSGKEPPFYLGYAHEALARAALLTKDRPAFDEHLAAAKALAAKVADAGEKKMLEDDLAGLVFP